MNQHHESISLAAGIFLIDKKIMDQLWSVWDEMFKVPKTNKYHQLQSAKYVYVERRLNIKYLTDCTYRWCKWPGQHCGAHNCDGAPGRPGWLA